MTAVPTWETPTMAELYCRQGLPERARAIYRKILRDKPEHAVARQRLLDLETGARDGGHVGFRQAVQQIVDQVPGTLACVVMGYDGVPVEHVTVGGSLDTEGLLAQISVACQPLRDLAGRDDGPGALQHVSLTTDKLQIELLSLSADHFLAAVLEPGAIAGQARYMMRRHQEVLVRALQ